MIKRHAKDEELALIKQTMNFYIAGIRAEQQARYDAAKNKPPEPLELISMGDLAGIPDGELEARSMYRGPIESAYRLAFKKLGWRLWTLCDKNLTTVGAFIEEVADMEPNHYGRRISFLDHAMDGVGRVDGHPGWCVSESAGTHFGGPTSCSIPSRSCENGRMQSMTSIEARTAQINQGRDRLLNIMKGGGVMPQEASEAMGIVVGLLGDALCDLAAIRAMMEEEISENAAAMAEAGA